MNEHLAESDNRRILLVDDNEEIHSEFKLTLAPRQERLGDRLAQQILGSAPAPTAALEFRIDSAYQGDEAVERVRTALADNDPFALAIVDMRMPPGPDGLVTAEQLLSLDPEIQVLLCTAYSDYGWDEMQKRLGRTDRALVAKKPVEEVELQQFALALTQRWNEARARRRAEIQLDRLAVQTEMIMRSFAQAMLMVDADGAVSYANPVAESLLEHPASELLNHQPHALLHAHERACSQQPCPLATKLGDDPWRSEDQMLATRDGHDVPVSCAWTPIRDRDGVRRGAILAIRDLREQRALEAQLRQAQKLDTIGRLAAGVAHEINTPTQYVSNGLTFLEQAVADLGRIAGLGGELASAVDSGGNAPELAKRLEGAAREVDLDVLLEESPGVVGMASEGIGRIARIVKSINEFAHPTGGTKQPVDLNHLVENALTISRSHWKHLATLEKELADDLPAVPADRGDIEQVLLNLLVNACHAIEDVQQEGGSRQGLLKLSTARGDGFVKFSIEDNGCGLSDAIRDKIFDPFFTTKEVGRGTGQGLAIAHTTIVTRHGGTLDCESEPGCGTRFVIRLPLDPDAALLPVSRAPNLDRAEETR